jgi:hypothetical protein
MVAQVAADDPDTDPNTPQPKMVVCIKRPGTFSNHGAKPSNICSDKRVRNRISPIHMKSGKAANSQLALLSQKAENKFLPGKVLVKNACPIQPTMANVMAIHTPPAKNSSITTNKKAPNQTKSITCLPKSRRERGVLPPGVRRWV